MLHFAVFQNGQESEYCAVGFWVFNSLLRRKAGCEAASKAGWHCDVATTLSTSAVPSTTLLLAIRPILFPVLTAKTASDFEASFLQSCRCAACL